MDMDSCSLSPVVAGTDSPRLVRPALHFPLRNLATTNNMTNAMLSPTNSEYGTIGSPMSNLALNLSGLSTEGFGDTPRRKLSLSSTESTPIMTNTTPDSAGSVESGCFVDSPGSMIDSPTIEMTLQKRFPGISLKLDDGSGRKQRSLPFRRMNSLPMPQFRLSPVDFHEKNSSSAPMETSHSAESDLSSSRTTFPDDEGSQDSGVGFEKDLSSDGFCFAAPVGMPPRRGGHLKVISEDTCSPQKYSPSKERTSPRKFRSVSLSALSGLDSLQTRTGGNSPLKTSPLTSLDDDSDNDDGFLEVLDKEVEEISGGTLPNSFGSLFQAPVIQKETPSKSEDFLIRRNPKCKLLARSQSFDVRSRVCNKRQSPGREDDSTPVQKRRRGSCVAIPTQITPPPKALLKRCHSETEAMIKSALDRVAEDPDLIGDCSKPYCLPTVPGKHQDLKSITPETLSKVLNHEYDHIIDKFVIVDCRYPYEFEGGHIQGAQNYYTKESILTNLIENQVQPDNSLKRVVIIFHCEFSSERGPNLSRFLRNKDRGCNKDVYPQLYYPEIYLLHGGYKNFFETEKQCCVPQTYMPMHHQDYKEQMRRFRMKSKSWAGEKKSSRSALFKGF